MVPNAFHTRLCTLSLLFVLLSLVAAAAAQPPKVTEGEKFNALKEETVGAITKVSGYRAKEVYEEIDRLLKQVNSLYKKVQAAESTDAIIGDIELGIMGMAASYRKLATLEVDVTQTFYKERAILTATHQTTEGMASTIAAEIATHQKALADLERAVQGEANPIEKRKKELSIGGLKSRIKSIQNRKVVWDKFSTYQDQLSSVLRTNQDNIGLLFHALKTSAEVYEEAGKTIQLRRNAVDALGNLLGLPPLESIIADVTNTWLVIDDIVGKVSSADFTLEQAQTRPGM